MQEISKSQYEEIIAELTDFNTVRVQGLSGINETIQIGRKKIASRIKTAHDDYIYIDETIYPTSPRKYQKENT